mgnify:CR=1 FL=1
MENTNWISPLSKRPLKLQNGILFNSEEKFDQIADNIFDLRFTP